MANEPLNLHIKGTPPEEVAAFLQAVLERYEKGRLIEPLPDGSGYSARMNDAAWGELFRFVYEVVNGTAASTATAVAKAVGEHAYNEGGKAGMKQSLENFRKHGAKGLSVGQLAPLDSEAILKTIGGELRKMFEAGLVQGKSTTDAVIEAGKLAKPSGEIVKVQRNGAGEIIGAVKQLVYDGNGGA